jgi:hypothetical protein
LKALVDFLARYEPRYPSDIRGAPAELIAELEAGLGRSLPAPYRDFLATAGAAIGFDTGEQRFEIEAVLGLLARWEPIPERFVPVAADDGIGGFDYYLDFAHPAGAGDALVVRVGDGVRLGSESIPVFRSFRDMIFWLGFTALRVRAFPQQRVLLLAPRDYASAGAAPTPERATSVMAGLGFTALAVTGPEARLYERGDAAAALYQVPFRESFILSLAARGLTPLDEIAASIGRAFPAPR